MKKTHNKIITLLLILVVTFGAVFSGCGTGVGHDSSAKPEDRKQQVHIYNITESDDYLVKDGKTEYILLFPSENPEMNNNFAVQEFQTYFKRATGISIKAVTDNGYTYDETKKYISIGQTAVATQANVVMDQELSLELATGGFIIKTVGNSIFILGGSLGLFYGVYGFMEIYFNMEVYAEDEVYIDTGIVDQKFLNLDVKDIPDIEHQSASYGMSSAGMKLMRLEHLASVHASNRGRVWHNLNKGALPYEIYGVDETKNADKYGNAITDAMKTEITTRKIAIIDQLKAYSLADIHHLTGDTTITEDMLTDDWYTAKANSYFGHLEWYAMEAHVKENPLGDGSKFEPMQLNFTIAPENDSLWNDGSADWHVKSQQLFYEALFLELEKDYVASGKNAIVYTGEDNGGWSTDSISTANYEKYGTHAGEYIHSANRMARMFKEKYPGCTMTIFSYAAVKDAPTRYNSTTGKYEPIDETVILEDNIDVMVCMFFNRQYEIDDIEQNRATVEQEESWKAIASHFSAWLYSLVYYSNAFMPTSNTMTIPNTYRHLFENNYVFILDEARVGEHTSTDWAALKQFLLKEVRWDCYQDYDTLVNDFFTNYYKAAGQAMYDAWNLEMNWMLTSVQGGTVDFTGGTGGEGGMITALKTETAFPENVLLQILAKFDEAFKAIEVYKETNPGLYETLYDRINLETIPIRYLRIEIYGKYYGDLKNEWTRSLYFDAKDAGFVKVGSYQTLEQALGTWS